MLCLPASCMPQLHQVACLNSVTCSVFQPLHTSSSGEERLVCVRMAGDHRDRHQSAPCRPPFCQIAQVQAAPHCMRRTPC